MIYWNEFISRLPRTMGAASILLHVLVNLSELTFDLVHKVREQRMRHHANDRNPFTFVELPGNSLITLGSLTAVETEKLCDGSRLN